MWDGHTLLMGFDLAGKILEDFFPEGSLCDRKDILL